MMKINDLKPHFKKSGLEAINFDVVHRALPVINFIMYILSFIKC